MAIIPLVAVWGVNMSSRLASIGTALLACSLCTGSVSAQPDNACKFLLTKFSTLASCGFVTERSGSHYYALVFDSEPVREALKSNDKVAILRRLNDVVVAPLTILATEDEYPLAPVRIIVDEKPFSELTRAQYTDCAAQHGDPVDALKAGDEERKSAILACLYKKIFEHER